MGICCDESKYGILNINSKSCVTSKKKMCKGFKEAVKIRNMLFVTSGWNMYIVIHNSDRKPNFSLLSLLNGQKS